MMCILCYGALLLQKRLALTYVENRISISILSNILININAFAYSF